MACLFCYCFHVLTMNPIPNFPWLTSTTLNKSNTGNNISVLFIEKISSGVFQPALIWTLYTAVILDPPFISTLGIPFGLLFGLPLSRTCWFIFLLYFLFWEKNCLSGEKESGRQFFEILHIWYVFILLSNLVLKLVIEVENSRLKIIFP